MATRTVTALFDTYELAADAVRKLEAQGVSHSDISIVSNDAGHSQYYDSTGTGDGDHVSGTGTGASLGTLLGGGAGLLAGLGMLAIPGLGPVVAAGWLASTLVGAGVGAAAGGLVGSLTDAGVSHEDAHVYAEGVRRGGTLVTVRADDSMVDRVTNVLDADGTVDLDERESNWRAEGWNGEYVPTSTSSAPRAGTPSYTSNATSNAGYAAEFGGGRDACNRPGWRDRGVRSRGRDRQGRCTPGRRQIGRSGRPDSRFGFQSVWKRHAGDGLCFHPA